ncbi:carbamoyltransferase HypF [Pseudacidobacterium ailaaui]|jgi:hydrogenase maturation protein HypF|uniref:carbamoyltransferase HypF n=1 Tax=Pseudacidobacterium ailaaui TaxID=1382359 RepID=UPI0005D2A24D|nr:carbamoyltransferase HypF [Pseudacidobacterium ailaaui]
MQSRRRIVVSGIVQGVGFRPHVYRVAHRYGLSGYVRNTASGAAIEVQGPDAALGQFLEDLKSEAPPLARIAALSVEEVPCQPDATFEILRSASGEPTDALIAPDIATCSDCLHELLDPADRRYGYPFINCTNCGPRFTILRRIPYDRSNTSMASFPMCRACEQEYGDPLSRRFHAQPNSCWECGPRLTLLDREGDLVIGDPVGQLIEFLRAGSVVAVKGLGGFHLSVDATNPTAVEELRRRKRRFEKPFAVMVADTRQAEEFCFVGEQEREILESPEHPIVILRARQGSRLPVAIAPGNPHLGIFLPYTPVQHLLFSGGNFTALVMTSANLSEEPLCIDNDEAVERLRGIADFFLVHNRDILLRCDDSVVRTAAGSMQILRRSRGFVPVPLILERECSSVLAVGGELKNSICLIKGKRAFLGQHIGDLENLAAYKFFEESITHLEGILGLEPTVIAHDLHPGYLSTQWALGQKDVPTVAVQHHHAHAASCMAENHLSAPVIAVVLDGTGYGSDGAAWGGEVMIADFGGFRRVAHLEYTAMPGGVQAIREPWRMAVAYLSHAGEGCLAEGLRHLKAIPSSQVEIVRHMAEQRVRSPLTSSCGRLFDAVAALIGLRTTVSFEAQAAIELEFCWKDGTGDDEYHLPVKRGECLEIETGPLFEQIVDDLKRNISPEVISRRFHQGLVSSLANLVQAISQESGIKTVCLSGGCFLNEHLANGLVRSLKSNGFLVYTQSQVPCGDGGLSLGQAVIAAHSENRGNHP